MKDLKLSTTPADTANAWDTYWHGVGSEEWLTARQLIELSPALHSEAAAWLKTGKGWDLTDWIHDVDDTGRAWSTTESRLFRVVAALIDPYPDADWVEGNSTLPLYVVKVENDRYKRTVPLVYFLEQMGSWETDVWRILVNWGTGGNNREYPGRATVVAR